MTSLTSNKQWETKLSWVEVARQIASQQYGTEPVPKMEPPRRALPEDPEHPVRGTVALENPLCSNFEPRNTSSHSTDSHDFPSPHSSLCAVKLNMAAISANPPVSPLSFSGYQSPRRLPSPIASAVIEDSTASPNCHRPRDLTNSTKKEKDGEPSPKCSKLESSAALHLTATDTDTDTDSASNPSIAGSDPGRLTSFGLMPVTRMEYNRLLQREMEWRQWHNDNLRKTLIRNLRGYQETEQRLREIAARHKRRYEAHLVALFPDDVEQQTVHESIGSAISSSKQQSGTMENIKWLLAENGGRVSDNRSFYEWRQKIESFVAEMKSKTERDEKISVSDVDDMRTALTRNAVEITKVREVLLREQLQSMAERYHQTLSRLRAECKWWRNRDRVLSQRESK